MRYEITTALGGFGFIDSTHEAFGRELVWTVVFVSSVDKGHFMDNSESAGIILEF